ncbi:MAG: GDP-mannose 4,6-dehydratase [Elusimicrobiota bacterium]
MKVLITGITGFAGSYMAEYVLNLGSGIEVFGTKRYTSNLENIRHILDKITLVECELRDQNCVDGVISKIKPDKIFHLAAATYIPTSFLYASDTINTNINSTLALLESVKKYGPGTIIHFCSSSEVYGRVEKNEIPINENNPLRPQNPYAVSKAACDLLVQQYYASYKLNVFISRAFGYIGPRAKDVFAYASFARQVVEIERGRREPVIYVGNLKSVRTFLDIRDIAESYWILTEKCTPGEVYVIGGDASMEVGEVLDRLIKLSDARKKIKVEVDPARLRPSDVTLQVPDSTKFRKQTGWAPKIQFEQTLKDLLNYWREKIGEKDGR